MESYLDQLLVYFHDGEFPVISDEVLQIISDFLIFSRDGEVLHWTPLLFDFMNSNLTRLMSSVQNISDNDYSLLCAILHTFRFFRPHHLTPPQRTSLENALFHLLSHFHGMGRRYAFILLLDHCQTSQGNGAEIAEKLVAWTLRFIEETTADVLGADHRLVFSVIYAVRILLKQLPPGSLQTTARPMFESFLKLIIKSLEVHASSEQAEMIASKTLRMISHFLDSSEAVPPNIFPLIKRIEELAPQDMKRFNLFQNWLIFICSFVKKTEPELMQMTEKGLQQILKNLPLLLHRPFSQSKAVALLMKSLTQWVIINKSNPKPEREAQLVFVVQNCLIHMSNLQGQAYSILVISEMIQGFLTADFFRRHAGFQTDLFAQMMDNFEVTKAQLDICEDTGMRYDFDVWTESQLQIMKVIRRALCPDPHNVIQIEHSISAFTNLFVRLTTYVGYVLDLVGHLSTPTVPYADFTTLLFQSMPARQFQDKLKQFLQSFLDCFVGCLRVLKESVFGYVLTTCMEVLLPSESHHVYHRVLHIFLHKNRGNHPGVYHTVFFEVLSSRFEELFMPVPVQHLIDLTRFLLQESFLTEPFVRDVVQRPQDMVVTYAYKVLVSCMTSKSPKLLDLSFTFLWGIFRNENMSRMRRDRIVELLRTDPISVRNILKQMMEEPELEAKASYLAMLLSVLILSGGKEVKPDMLESWIALFLPSLEKRDEISWSLYTLFYVGSRHFATWMSQVREALQSRILGAIGSSLPTLSPKDLTYAKSLLVKVPELFVKHAKNVTEWESKEVPVTINGKVVLLNVLFDAFKRIESATEAQIDAFADVFIEFLKQRSFTECLGMDLVTQIMTHLAKKTPEFVDSFYQNLEPPARYSALFLRQRHGSPINEIVAVMEDWRQFVLGIDYVCLKRVNIRAAVEIYKYLLPRIPNTEILSRINVNLIIACQYEPDIVREIYREICLRNFDSPEENRVRIDLLRNLEVAVDAPSKMTRRVVVPVVMALSDPNRSDVQKHPPSVPSKMEQHRKRIISDLAAYMEKDWSFDRLDFIFEKTFEDVPNVPEQIEKLCNVLVKKLHGLQAALELYPKHFSQYHTARFILKAIARLFPFIPNQRQAQTMWERVVMMLREAPRRHFIPYFLKQCKKVNQDGAMSLPCEMTALFQAMANSQLPPAPEEVMLINYSIESTRARNHSAHLARLQQAIAATHHAFRPMGDLSSNRREQIAVITEYLKIVATFKRIEDPIHDDSVFHKLLDLLVSVYSSFNRLDLPFYFLTESYPGTVLQWLIAKCDKTWNVDVISLVFSWVSDPRSRIFRTMMLNEFVDKCRYLVEFAEQNHMEMAGSLLMRAFSCLQEIYESMSSNDADLILLWKASKCLYVTYLRLSKKRVTPRPSIFAAILKIFVPLKFASKLNEDELVFEYYRKEVVNLITGICVLSCHPHFVSRFTEMVKHLSFEKRTILYQEFASKNLESSVITYLLVRLIETERYKAFSDEMPVVPTSRGTENRPGATVLLSFFDAFLEASLAVNPNAASVLENCSIIRQSSYLHALAISHGLLRIEDVTFISRLMNVTKAMTSFDHVNLSEYDCSSVLIGLLKEHAFSLKQFLVCFAVMGQKFPASQVTKDVMKYLLAFAICSQDAGSQMVNRQGFLFCLTPAFERIHSENIAYAAPVVLEILLSTAVQFLQKNDGIKMIQSLPQVVEMYAKITPVLSLTKDIVDRLRDALSKPTSRDAQQTNQTRTRFVFELLPPLADLFCGTSCCPVDVLPSSFFTVSYHREMKAVYEACLKGLVRTGDRTFSKLIIENVYTKANDRVLTKEAKLSGPLPSAFATLALWMNEGQHDNTIFPILQMLIDIMKPHSPEQAFFDFRYLKQPLHPSVSTMIEDIVNEYGITDSTIFLKCPNIFPLFCSHSDDIVNDVWKVDWFMIDQNAHLQLFLKMAFSGDLGFLVNHLKEREMAETAVRLLQNCPTQLERFFKVYVGWFPSSGLAEAISFTPWFSHDYPFPSLSVFGNMTRLERLNLCDDSLGLLKDALPNLSQAATFQQLSNYKAAKGYYLSAMDHDPSSYFYGLMKVRTCVINMGLPVSREMFHFMLRTDAASVPKVTLPFVQDSTFNFDFKQTSSPLQVNKLFTTSLSPSHIPFIMNTALFDETFHMLKALQAQPPDVMLSLITSLIRSTRSVWMKGLDNMMIMSSTFVWRMTVLSELLSNGDHQIEKFSPQIRESIVMNQVNLSKMHVHSGNLKAAFALTQNIAPLGKEYYSFKIKKNQLPRVWRFVSRMSAHGLQLFRIRAFQAVKNYARAFRECQNVDRSEKSSVWLRTLVEIMVSKPNLVEAERVMMQLLGELNGTDTKRQYLFVCLALQLLDRDPELKRTLSASIGQMKDGQRKVWMRWFPMLMSRCPKPPMDFILSLMKAHPMYFVLNMRHIQYSSSSPEIEAFLNELDEVLRQRQLDRFQAEFNNVFEFLDNKEDVRRLAVSVVVLRRTYGMLLSEGEPKVPSDLSEQFSSVDEMVKFCEENPPVYISKARACRFNSIAGFHFPCCSPLIMRILLDADGSKEASVSMLTLSGEVRQFSLVCSRYYRLCSFEHLFSVAIWRAVQNHPSSSARTNFVYYPASYMLQQNILLVDSKPFDSMSSIAKPHSVLTLLAESRRNITDTSRSPLANKELQTSTLPSDLLFQWFVKGTDGDKRNFLFMRQGMASHFGASCFVHSLFGPVPAYIPPVMFFADRHRVCFPGFSESMHAMQPFYLPLTSNIEKLFPKWVLKGSFSTSWHTVAEGLSKNLDKTSLIYQTFQKQFAAKTASRQYPDPRVRLEGYLQRLAKMTSQISEDTEKTDDVFPFSVLDHLIETSHNANLAQLVRAGWI